MKDIDNPALLEVTSDAVELASKTPIYSMRLQKRTTFLRWLLTFSTCVFVPMCQSMPTHITINQIEHQNIQTVNVSYTQNK